MLVKYFVEIARRSCAFRTRGVAHRFFLALFKVFTVKIVHFATASLLYYTEQMNIEIKCSQMLNCEVFFFF